MITWARGWTALCVLLVTTVPAGAAAQKVLVVYHSPTGHTALMARAVAEGAEGVPGSEVRILSVAEASPDDVLWADALIVGSPVHAANIAAPVAEFLAHFPFGGQMRDKLGAAFVTAGGISAGEEAVQLAILRAMLVYNMIVVGGPSWAEAFGASGITQEEPFADTHAEAWLDPMFLAKGQALGERVAELAKRLLDGGGR